MPRLISAADTFDSIEDEILYTIAALQADPDAADFVPMTAGWLARVAGARSQDIQVRQASAAADARREVANGRLDHECKTFGDELYFAVNKDRGAPRWKQFFKMPVSTFVKRGLDEQAATVEGWLQLAPGHDPVLDAHRPGLARWSGAAGDALVATRAVAPTRGLSWQAREELAHALTRERDGVHEALAQRARERDLPREWPSLFFRVQHAAHHVVVAPAPAAAGQGTATGHP